MKFEKVIDGILRYLDSDIFEHMNDWQEMLARIAVSRMAKSSGQLKEFIINNPFLATFQIVDSEGNVDVDELLSDVREQIARKEKLVLSFPVFGKFTFTAADVDRLHEVINKGVTTNEDYR
jgi:hypothetical protein